MATTTDPASLNKIYISTVNGQPTAQIQSGYNTPYSYQATDFAGLATHAKSMLDFYKQQAQTQLDRGQNINSTAYQSSLNEYNRLGGDSAYQQLSSGQYDPLTISKIFNLDVNQLTPFATGGASSSGYITDPITGNLTTQSAIDSQAANEAGVANGTLRKVPVGSGWGYVPVGSAADYNQQGMSYEQQLQQPSVQQQIQQQGLTPVNPNSQTPTPAGTSPAGSVGQGIQPLNQTVPVAPTFDQALFQEYRNRPDLQALYNQDGSAKNPNDPRLAGIPTLQEWAMKYGVNESALLKGASPSPASIPTTPVSLNPSTQVSSSLLTGGKTMSDVQGLIEGNSKKYGDIRDQILKAMMPSQGEMDLEKRLNDIEALSRNINLSAQAGINKIKDQPVAMQFIVGQAKSVMEDANLQLQTMAAEQASVVDRLGLAQKARQTSLQVLETLYQFDKEDQALADAKSKLQKAEQESAKEFAMQHGITAPFYLIGKTVYNSATGKPYEDEKSFFAAGGAKDFSNVQKVSIKPDLKGLPNSYQEYVLTDSTPTPTEYDAWMTKDANRKAVRSTTINNTANKTEDRVRQIVQMNPNNWANAAAQIDKEFGVGTATLYDSYLKESYKSSRQ